MKEHGVIIKRCKDCVRVALLYPAPYTAAVASLAYQMLYYLINSLDYAVAERFVLPALSPLKEPLQSLESRGTLRHFDIVIVPVSYELDTLYALHALLSSGIDPRRSRNPLIVLGGPVPAMNPTPYTRLANVIVVGEIEETIPKLLEAVAAGSVEELRASDGFITRSIVESGERARRVIVRDLDSAFHPVTEFRVPGSGEPWGEAYLLEVSRGCWRMCRFCLEAFFTHPWRYRSYGRVRELMLRGVETNDVNRVAFYSLSFFDHPYADAILEAVVEEGLEATIGSLRVDTLTEDRLELLKRVGQKTVTVAPETFIPRLYRLLGKPIGFEKTMEVVEAAVRLGLKPKLYLMTGLPFETLDDVEHEAILLSKIVRVARDARVSLNPLVPKPWTPLQYAPFVERKWYEEAVRRYRKSVGGRLDALSYRWAWAQAVIARGDEEVGEAILRAAAAPSLGRLIRELRATRIAKMIHAGFEPGVELPWERLVDPGYPRNALRVSYEFALREAKGG